jgi:hypothetical protein
MASIVTLLQWHFTEASMDSLSGFSNVLGRQLEDCNIDDGTYDLINLITSPSSRCL